MEALASLLRDPLRRERLGKRGAEVVRRNFSSAAFEHGLEQILVDAGVASNALK